jgi:flagellar protein FlgJ
MIVPASKNALPRVTSVDPEVRKAAISCEAVMLRQLIGAMRKGQLAEGVFGSSANSNYREMADARIAGVLAERGALGIAALIEKQLQGTVK